MRSTTMLSRSACFISALLGATLLAWHAHAAPASVLASTTSVQDSGLLGRILPLFFGAGTNAALEAFSRLNSDYPNSRLIPRFVPFTFVVTDGSTSHRARTPRPQPEPGFSIEE